MKVISPTAILSGYARRWKESCCASITRVQLQSQLYEYVTTPIRRLINGLDFIPRSDRYTRSAIRSARRELWTSPIFDLITCVCKLRLFAISPCSLFSRDADGFFFAPSAGIVSCANFVRDFAAFMLGQFSWLRGTKFEINSWNWNWVSMFEIYIFGYKKTCWWQVLGTGNYDYLWRSIQMEKIILKRNKNIIYQVIANFTWILRERYSWIQDLFFFVLRISILELNNFYCLNQNETSFERMDNIFNFTTQFNY